MSRLLAAILVFFSLAAGTAQAQSLTASPSSLYASDTTTAAWSGIASPTSTDWVGLYAVGAPDTAVLVWAYTNGSASGSAPIVVPNTTAAGSYELRIFANNSYTKLATSNGITVQPPPPANLSASPASLNASQTVTAAWSSIYSPTSTDWVGLYAVGAADSAVIAWTYANGSASGSAPIVVPNTTAPGAYELRLFSNNSYAKLATSNGITVQPQPAANLTAAPASLYASQSVTASWSSILAPTATDWIGLYAAGAPDIGGAISWQFTNGSASGSVPIVVPNTTAAGAYELRLFANNTYTKLATSNGVTVQPPPPANLTAAPANLYASQSVTANWSSILAPTATDWIGMYAVGAPDNAVIAYQYASGSASGSVPIQVPNTTVAGAYELRLFANNTYTKLATSNGFTVDPPPPATLTVTGSGAPGGSVTANWASILAPTATDWLGLYLPGAADNAVLAWQYTTGVAAGNVPFSLPANLALGSYELRLFANNSYTRLASASFGVGVMKLSFIQVDHLNTPRQVYDDQQQLRWKWDQAEPFGVNTPDENPVNLGAFEMPLRFPGQYGDKETILSYNYFRDFDAGLGRYVQSDPLGLRGGLNTYSYAYAAPLSYFDPTGLFCLTPGEIKLIAGTIGGAAAGAAAGGGAASVPGALFGAAVGFGAEYFKLVNAGPAGITAAGATGAAAMGAASAGPRGAVVGFLAGAMGGLTESQSPGPFQNTIAGGIGGGLGTFMAELMVNAKPYRNPGIPLQRALRGGVVGLFGGLVQDGLEEYLTMMYECKYCKQSRITP